MNVYLRSGEVDEPSPDMDRTVDEEDASFLLDADLVVDRLPQPYRTIDKILMKIFDIAWEEIEMRESRYLLKEHKRNQRLFASKAIDALIECSTISFSPDSKFLFASMFSGELAVFCIKNHQQVCIRQIDEEEPSCMETIKCILISDDVYLLACIDDMGFGKLLIFFKDEILFVQNLNAKSEGGLKSNVEKIQLDLNGSFCGLALSMDEKYWLEFYKLPKDNWIQEIKSSFKKSEPEFIQNEKDGEIQEENSENVDNEANNRMIKVNFSNIVLQLKVNQPSELIGNNYSTYKEILDRNSLPFGIGTGSDHLFTEEHLTLRRATISKIHEDKMKYLKNKPDIEYIPTWHFLKTSKLQPRSCPSQTTSNTVAVLIWWSNSYSAEIYPLVYQKATSNTSSKTSSPEIVWPLSCLISASAVSSSTIQVAFGLERGSVVVIDRMKCIPLITTIVRRGISVRNLCFLSSKSHNRLLVGMAEGGVSLVDCDENICRHLSNRVDDGDFEVTLLSPFPPVSSTEYYLCAASNDRLELLSINSNSVGYDLIFTDSLEDAGDRFWCVPNGNKIYAKNDDATICAIELENSIPFLNANMLQLPQIEDCKNNFESKIENFFSQRCKDQSFRTVAFRKRWFEIVNDCPH